MSAQNVNIESVRYRNIQREDRMHLILKCPYYVDSGAPDFTSGFQKGSCCPVIGVSLFPVFWILSWIVPLV